VIVTGGAGRSRCDLRPLAAWFRTLAGRILRVDAVAGTIDLLDHYRDAVERIVAECNARIAEEELESFFFHVITCFERTMGAETCAIAWVAGRPSKSPQSAAQACALRIARSRSD
jgi:hypothetical protein